jgi:hypothetical protein
MRCRLEKKIRKSRKGCNFYNFNVVSIFVSFNHSPQRLNQFSLVGFALEACKFHADNFVLFSALCQYITQLSILFKNRFIVELLIKQVQMPVVNLLDGAALRLGKLNVIDRKGTV